jgi:two-component system, LytTR family, response regulator
MKVLIVEDEEPAAQRLVQLIKKAEPTAEILGILDSVKGVVKWLSKHAAPDLLFLDIQLADGLSFEIFDWVDIPSPVIFCTAYDAYAIQAFKHNSVDYLLKPTDLEEVSTALGKFRRWKGELRNSGIASMIEELKPIYKERFLVKIGEHIKTVPVSEISFFYSLEKATFCQTVGGNVYLLDPSLEKVEKMLNSKDYFRVNRKYLISIFSIQDIISYNNSRLRIILKGSKETDCIVARERVNDFKAWLDR